MDTKLSNYRKRLSGNSNTSTKRATYFISARVIQGIKTCSNEKHMSPSELVARGMIEFLLNQCEDSLPAKYKKDLLDVKKELDKKG